MAVLGEGSQVTWSEELRVNGRVVFTLRPKWVLKAQGIVWLVALVQVLRTIGADDKFRIGFTVVLLVLAVASSAWYGWRIFQCYPALTIDRNGIRTGHNRFLPWAEVGAVGHVQAGLGQKRVPIVPKDRWAKELTVDQSAIKDIPAFAHWLEGVLTEQRAAGGK